MAEGARRGASSSQRTKVALPVVLSRVVCLSAVSSAATSPLTTVEFSQVASAGVVDTTYLRAPFIWAVIGSPGSAFGQYPANSSYVCRPSSIASVSLMLAPTTAPISSSKCRRARSRGRPDDPVER